jgi:hypothetical protein
MSSNLFNGVVDADLEINGRPTPISHASQHRLRNEWTSPPPQLQQMDWQVQRSVSSSNAWNGSRYTPGAASGNGSNGAFAAPVEPMPSVRDPAASFARSGSLGGHVGQKPLLRMAAGNASMERRAKKKGIGNKLQQQGVSDWWSYLLEDDRAADEAVAELQARLGTLFVQSVRSLPVVGR